MSCRQRTPPPIYQACSSVRNQPNHLWYLSCYLGTQHSLLCHSDHRIVRGIDNCHFHSTRLKYVCLFFPRGSQLTDVSSALIPSSPRYLFLRRIEKVTELWSSVQGPHRRGPGQSSALGGVLGGALPQRHPHRLSAWPPVRWPSFRIHPLPTWQAETRQCTKLGL